jgi:hypothetical protein
LITSSASTTTGCIIFFGYINFRYQDANENSITYEELFDEHKQKYDGIKAAFEADLIGSFERTRHHGIRWKGFSSEGALDEVDLSTPTEECT